MEKNKFSRVSFLSLDYLSHRFADLLAEGERTQMNLNSLFNDEGR